MSPAPGGPSVFTLMCHDEADDASAAAPPEHVLRPFRVGANQPYLVLHQERVGKECSSEPLTASPNATSSGDASGREAGGPAVTEVSDTAP